MGKKQKRPDWKEQEDRSKKQAAKQAKKDPTLKKLWDRYDELVANLTEFALSQPQDSFLVKSARGDLGRQLDNLTSASLVGTSPYQKLCAACSPESYEAVNQELLTVEREFNKYKDGILCGVSSGVLGVSEADKHNIDSTRSSLSSSLSSSNSGFVQADVTNSEKQSVEATKPELSQLQQKQGELTQTESDFFYDLQYLSGQLPRELKDLESEYPGQDLKSLTICMEELGKSIESLIQSTLGFYKNLKENPTSEEAKKAFALHLGNFAEFTGLYKQYKQHIDILVKEKPKIHRHNAKKKGAAEKTITIPKKTSELPIKHPEMPAPDPNKMASNSLLSFDSSLLKPVQRVLKYPLLFKEIIQESKDDEREAWYTLEAKAKSTAETINEMHRMNQQHFFNLCLEGMSVITKQDRSGQELLKLMRQAKTPEEKLKFSDSADMKNILQYFEKKSPDQYKLLQKNSLEFISKSELREAWQEYSHLDAKMQKAESGFSEHEMTLYRSQMLYVKEQLYQGDIQGVKNALKVAEVFFRSRELGIQIEELKQQCALLDVQLQALPDDKFKVAKGKGIAEILTSLNKATPTTVEVLSRLVAEIGEEINEHKELSSAMQLYATLKEKIDKATGADLYEAEMFYMQEKLAHAKENITRNDTPAALGFLQEIQKAFSEIERFKKLPSLSAQKTSRLSMRGVLGSLIQKVVSSLLRIGHPNKVSPEARDPALRASDTVLDVPDNRRSKTQPAGTPTQQIGGGPHDPSQLQQQKHTKTPVGFLPELQEVQKKRAEQQNQCPGTGGSDPDPRRRPDSQC